MLVCFTKSERKAFRRRHHMVLFLFGLVFLGRRRIPSFRSIDVVEPKFSHATSVAVVPAVVSKSDQGGASLSERTFVAIVACTKSLRNWTHTNESTIYNSFLPSILKSVSAEEWEKYRIEVVLAFDTGDPFWEKQINRATAWRGEALEDGSSDRKPSIPVNWLSFRQTEDSRIPFNQLCRATYDYGADYIVRVNDDTVFSSGGWLTQAIHVLSQFDPPNVGVVGPKSKGDKQAIMTHDMVSRIHLQIFDTYYPKEFRNFYVDDWISSIYGETRTKKIDSWRVIHRTSPKSRRYSPSRGQKKHLNKLIQQGTARIQQYIENPLSTPVITNRNGAILGCASIGLAEGRIAEVHKSIMKREGGDHCLFK